MSVVWCLLPDVRRLTLDVWCHYVWYQTSDIRCHMSDIRRLMSDVTSDFRRLMSDDRRLMSYVWCLMFVWCHQMSDDRRLMSYVWYQTSDGRRLILDVRCKMTDVVLSEVRRLVSDIILMSDIRCHFYTRVLSGTKIEISRVGDFVRSYYQPLGFFWLLIISSFNLSCHSHFRVSLL